MIDQETFLRMSKDRVLASLMVDVRTKMFNLFLEQACRVLFSAKRP
jgi:hypothetical protein